MANLDTIKDIQIIGYIHICQKGQWERSFKMLIDCIKKSGLYENTHIIRLGILADGEIDTKILNDSKFEIVYVGKPPEYERPTLLHMRKSSETDYDNTVYYYLHTKGIQHFGTNRENNVIDWINLMLYWNIEKWQLALKKLNYYNTYGCNTYKNINVCHYSGNFWWARRNHIIELPTFIESYYTAPEDWVCLNKNKLYCVFKSGLQGCGHYVKPYPRKLYDKKLIY